MTSELTRERLLLLGQLPWTHAPYLPASILHRRGWRFALFWLLTCRHCKLHIAWEQKTWGRLVAQVLRCRQQQHVIALWE